MSRITFKNVKLKVFMFVYLQKVKSHNRRNTFSYLEYTFICVKRQLLRYQGQFPL